MYTRPDLGPLFNHIPAVRTSPTSLAAARKIAPRAGSIKAAVLEWFRAQPNGATDGQMIAHFGGPAVASTYRPRRVDLVREGWLVDSGRVEVNERGNGMAVWRCA